MCRRPPARVVEASCRAVARLESVSRRCREVVRTAWGLGDRRSSGRADHDRAAGGQPAVGDRDAHAQHGDGALRRRLVAAAGARVMGEHLERAPVGELDAARSGGHVLPEHAQPLDAGTPHVRPGGPRSRTGCHRSRDLRRKHLSAEERHRRGLGGRLCNGGRTGLRRCACAREPDGGDGAVWRIRERLHLRGGSRRPLHPSQDHPALPRNRDRDDGCSRLRDGGPRRRRSGCDRGQAGQRGGCDDHEANHGGTGQLDGG